jgi:glycosyltransferase involved in cell wall biosynthesis
MSSIVQPKVSIILPVFNGDRYLAEAIESVLAQSFSSYELIAVNDGSTDKSAEILSRYSSQHPERIFVLQHPRGNNRGVATSRNLALRHARGEYIAFLDQDDVWNPEKLAIQVPFMDSNRNVGLTYTQSEIIRESGAPDFMPGRKLLTDPAPDDKQTTLYKVMLLELSYTFSSVMVRATAIRRVGGFMENLPFQSDDRIMVAQISADFKIAEIDQVLCAFRASAHHYTGDLIKSGLSSIVMFDLQLRITGWLSRSRHYEWAIHAASYVLPRTYLNAVSDLNKFVERYRLSGLPPTASAMFRRMALHALNQHRSWSRFDPLGAMLRGLAEYKPWAMLPVRCHMGANTQAIASPLVSVIIPAFNAEKTLGRALGSVISQVNCRFEVFVVDDGSRDQTLSIALDYQRKHPGIVSVLQHPGAANRGVSATRNLGIQHASGAYCAFLDADDVWHPQKLEIQVGYMERFPQIALSYTKARIRRSGSGAGFMPAIDVLGHIPTRSLMYNAKMILMLEINYIFSTVMVRTGVLREAGGFMENLPFQSEDRIMVACVSTKHMVGRIPRLLADYHAHDDSYSVGAIQQKKAEIIFWDMRVRVICWMASRGDKAEALWIARMVMPSSLIDYLKNGKMRHAKLFFTGLFHVLKLFPCLPLEWLVAYTRQFMAGRKGNIH